MQVLSVWVNCQSVLYRKHQKSKSHADSHRNRVNLNQLRHGILQNIFDDEINGGFASFHGFRKHQSSQSPIDRNVDVIEMKFEPNYFGLIQNGNSFAFIDSAHRQEVMQRFNGRKYLSMHRGSVYPIRGIHRLRLRIGVIHDGMRARNESAFTVNSVCINDFDPVSTLTHRHVGLEEEHTLLLDVASIWLAMRFFIHSIIHLLFHVLIRLLMPRLIRPSPPL